MLADPLTELEEARRALEATRGVVKSQMRSLRTCLSFLGDLDSRLEELDASLALRAPGKPIGGGDLANRNA